MKKIIVLFLFILLSLNLANALTYTVNQPALIKVPCINNGTYCSNAATCNLTVIYRGITLLKDGVMTNQHTYFNYTFNNNTEIGTYDATMNCIDAGHGGVQSFSYEVTSTGDNSNWSFWLILVLFSMAITGVAIYSGNEYIMFIASGSILVTGVYSLIYGVMNIFNVYTQSISVIILGIGIFFLIISSLKAIAEASGEDTVGGWGPGGEDDYDYFKE